MELRSTKAEVPPLPTGYEATRRPLMRTRVASAPRPRSEIEEAAGVKPVALLEIGTDPPLETVIAFWSEERRHHFKIFKQVAEVVPEDLPPYWLRGSFVVPEDWECGCC